MLTAAPEVEVDHVYVVAAHAEAPAACGHVTGYVFVVDDGMGDAVVKDGRGPSYKFEREELADVVLKGMATACGG